MPSMPLRRKKWTEEEEEALITKYGELLQSGFLSKTKLRERKFEPIAAHVNALFHARNPVAHPWLWSWKDASTKVQNMRHQYLGVKQKIRKMVPSAIDPTGEHEVFDWEDGVSLWPNFLKYKAVFGDQELDVNEFFTHPPANPRSLPLRHHRRPLLPSSSHVQTHSTTAPFQPVSSNVPHSLMHSPSSGFSNAANNGSTNSLAKDFIDNGTGLANANGTSLLGCVKDAVAVPVDQAILDGDPGTIGLNFEYDAEGDEHAMKDACDEYEDDDDGGLDYARQKRRRHWGRIETGLDGGAHESQLLAFIASQFAELREREAKREEREIEREKARERIWNLLSIEREKQEWQREKREMEQAKVNEAERQEADMQDRELKRCMMEQQWREIERERDREREEKMERDKMEWREKMENRAMQHQAAMMQIQLQIAQCLQSSAAMLTGLVAQIAGQANDVTGQASSAGPLFPQFLQNLQTHGTGVPNCGIRRGTGESSDSQFDVDG